MPLRNSSTTLNNASYFRIINSGQIPELTAFRETAGLIVPEVTQ